MRLDYVSNEDDWHAIYINGMLHHEGHDIPRFVWMNLITFGFEDADEWFCEWEYDGRAPEAFSFLWEQEPTMRYAI